MTLTEWKEKMMEEVEGTVFISCIMEEVPHKGNAKRYEVYNEQGTFSQLYDITLDNDNNVLNVE